MDKWKTVIILLVVAAGIDRLCTLVPSDIYYDPFLLYDMRYECDGVVYDGVNLQYIVKAVSVHARNIMGIIACWVLAPAELRRLLLVFAFFELLSVADFFIIYEQSFFSIGKYNVEFTDFKIIGYATATYLWKIRN